MARVAIGGFHLEANCFAAGRALRKPGFLIPLDGVCTLVDPSKTASSGVGNSFSVSMVVAPQPGRASAGSGTPSVAA